MTERLEHILPEFLAEAVRHRDYNKDIAHHKEMMRHHVKMAIDHDKKYHDANNNKDGNYHMDLADNHASAEDSHREIVYHLQNLKKLNRHFKK